MCCLFVSVLLDAFNVAVSLFLFSRAALEDVSRSLQPHTSHSFMFIFLGLRIILWTAGKLILVS